MALELYPATVMGVERADQGTKHTALRCCAELMVIEEICPANLYWLWSVNEHVGYPVARMSRDPVPSV